jgi:hypothetical protein|tara:strand:+ start:7148 stop:7321 length:174 start_codon:yes stop_codon:yes gene_type:complete
MAETKHYVDEAMDQMMDSLAEQAETERLRQIAIEAGICMYCGVGAEGGACGDYKCWI